MVEASPASVDSKPVVDPRLAAHILVWISFGLLAWLSLPLAERWGAVMQYPYQLDAEEGFLLNQALRVARGETIYPSIDRPPFLVGNYPPVYPLLYSWVNGSEIDPQGLPRGRALVITATIMAALLLALMARLLTRGLAPTLLAPALFFATYEVHHWSAFARVDLPALALTLMGLAVFLAARRSWHLAVSGLLFVAAVYTRQTAVFAPAACLAAMWFGDRRRIPWFAGAWLGTGLIVLVALQIMTRGQFWKHIVTYNANLLDWSAWRAVMLHEVWLFQRWWLAAAALAAVILVGWFRGVARQEANGVDTSTTFPRPGAALVFVLFAGLTTAFSLPSMAKTGSAPNYLLEPLAAWSLLTALALGLVLKNGPWRVCSAGGWSWMRRVIPLLLAGLLLAHGVHLFRVRAALHSSRNPTAGDARALSAVVSRIRGIDGPAYAEEPVLALLAGKEVVLQPFILSQLGREGRWNDGELMRLLKEQFFGLLVVNEDLSVSGPGHRYRRYTNATAAAVRMHYLPAGRLDLPGLASYFFWEPGTKRE